MAMLTLRKEVVKQWMSITALHPHVNIISVVENKKPFPSIFMTEVCLHSVLHLSWLYVLNPQCLGDTCISLFDTFVAETWDPKN